MKRTIAEAWTKANDKKGGKGGKDDGHDHDLSGNYDFLNKK